MSIDCAGEVRAPPHIFIIEKQSLNFNDWTFMAQKLRRQIMLWVPVNWNSSVGSQLNDCLDEEKKTYKNSFGNNQIDIKLHTN